ncbi:hypothetical protein ACM55G_12125 [Flavobacterium sp. LB3P122]
MKFLSIKTISLSSMVSINNSEGSLKYELQKRNDEKYRPDGEV